MSATSSSSFYNNLQTLCNLHNYEPNHIWNSNKIGIQATSNLKLRSWLENVHPWFTTSPNLDKWLIVNCVVNFIKLLHLKKIKVERQLHQVLQGMHVYGNANRSMDDKIPIQIIPIVLW
jgi:hypothetical protein